jgi:F0F1-type ATP synthase epsilon subunit
MPEEQKTKEKPAEVIAEAKKAKAKRVELDPTKIHVKLYSPFKTYYDDNASSISAENDTGPFDILPQHHNFITLLNACEITIHSLEGKEVRIQINKGVMHVRNNKVTVFLDV